MSEPLRMLRIDAADRPGTIEIIAAAFSSRGISLESFNVVKESDLRGRGISLTYRASAARHDHMVRLVARMSCVGNVEVVEVDDAHALRNVE